MRITVTQDLQSVELSVPPRYSAHLDGFLIEGVSLRAHYSVQENYREGPSVLQWDAHCDGQG